MKYLLLIFLIGCGNFTPQSIKYKNNNDLVVRATGTIIFGMNAEQDNAVSANRIVNVNVAADVKFNMDDSNFIIPVDTALDSLDFGILDLTQLRDNNLSVCGVNNDQKCTRAVIRAYTTNTNGPGLWNDIEGYGAPLSADNNELGLEVGNATILQDISISTNKRVIRSGDFTDLTYQIITDFSNAGVGSYSTTIIIEYALGL
jgi:hypothetical protein